MGFWGFGVVDIITARYIYISTWPISSGRRNMNRKFSHLQPIRGEYSGHVTRSPPTTAHLLQPQQPCRLPLGHGGLAPAVGKPDHDVAARGGAEHLLALPK